MAKIAFIYSKDKLSGKLTKFFTGSYCYHVAWVDDDLMFDMHLIRRVRHWPHYDPGSVVLIDSPVEITREYLFDKLATDESTYGFLDYCKFALRPIYHLLGKSTPNAGGVICSEMIYNDLKANGWPINFDEVPSPADLEGAILSGKG